eukprot:15224374-Heterocapsa_arctica.AAC.1
MYDVSIWVEIRRLRGKLERRCGPLLLRRAARRHPGLRPRAAQRQPRLADNRPAGAVACDGGQRPMEDQWWMC